MALKIYDATTVVARKRSTHSVNVNFKTGLFTLSSQLVETLALKKDEKLAIAQDVACPKDWYIVKSSTGFDLREKQGGLVMFNSSPTAKALSESVGIDYSTTYLVGKEWQEIDGVKGLPIFTKSGIKDK